MFKVKKGICCAGIMTVCCLSMLLFGQQESPASFLLTGQMLDRDVAVNGQCQFRAELWDQKTGYGARIGSVQVYDISLEQGRFQIRLNERGEFGPGAFRNQGYWLELGVKCSGDSDFVRFEDRRWVGAAAASYELDWWTVDGGGGTSTGGNLELTGTIGQPDTGTAAGGSFTVYGGFWGAPGSGYRIYLPAISKLP
jgi:hypothetical protein